MLENKRFSGKFRQSSLDQHVETVRWCLADRKIDQRLHHTHPVDLLSGARKPDGLAAFIPQDFFKGVDRLPEVMLDAAGSLFGQDFDQPPECRLFDLGYAQPLCVFP